MARYEVTETIRYHWTVEADSAADAAAIADAEGYGNASMGATGNFTVRKEGTKHPRTITQEQAEIAADRMWSAPRG